MDQIFPSDVLIIDAPFAGAPLSLFLIKGDGWTLIDTGVARTPQAYIFPFLKRHGIDPAELRHVVITHGHHDHCGGNLALYRACPNAGFLAHERDAGWAEAPLRYLNEMYLSFCPQWEPDALPGRSPASTGPISWTCWSGRTSPCSSARWPRPCTTRTIPGMSSPTRSTPPPMPSAST